jgi:hypothetical protein
MKTKLILILTLALSSFAPETDEKVANIIDNRQVGWPTEHTAGHKDKDIEIYRVIPDSSRHAKEAYAVVTYRMKDNQLKFSGTFIYETENVYEKVSYRWDNDTILKYRLYNDSSKLAETFSLHLDEDFNQREIENTTCHK